MSLELGAVQSGFYWVFTGLCTGFQKGVIESIVGSRRRCGSRWFTATPAVSCRPSATSALLLRSAPPPAPLVPQSGSQWEVAAGWGGFIRPLPCRTEKHRVLPSFTEFLGEFAALFYRPTYGQPSLISMDRAWIELVKGDRISILFSLFSELIGLYRVFQRFP